MSELDDATKAGAGRAVLLVLGSLAVVGGALVATLAGAPGPGARLVQATVLVTDARLPELGVGVVDGGFTQDLSTVMAAGGITVAIRAHGGQPLTGFSYWRVQICATPLDGGADPGGAFLGPGVQVVYDDGDAGACSSGAPIIEAWEQGRADAPFPCFCARDATCLLPDGGSALVMHGNRLELVSGPGCLPMACTQMLGSLSWPAGCPQ